MDAAERTAIEQACSRLTNEYAYFIDFGERDRFANLFTEECILDIGTGPRTSREEIRAGGAGQEGIRRHITTTTLIDVVDENAATGIVYFIVYRTDAEQTPLPPVVGHYKDRYVRTDEGWKFTERLASIDIVMAS